MGWFTGSRAACSYSSAGSRAALQRRDTATQDGRAGGRDANWWGALVVELAQLALGGVALYYTTRKLQSMDPTAKEKAVAQRAKALLSQRVGKDLRDMHFSDYEMLIAQDVVDREALDATFDMIGGMGQLLDEIRDVVVLPLVRPDLFKSNGRSSRLVSAPKGVLFYGSPGTGKTMLAKAIARESGATFINLRQSTLQSKWFGESTRMVAAVFSLAVKLAPCIIFIDEVDCFLGERGDGEINATLSMKTEFMTLWDGMLASPAAQGVMVLAATNRPDALDRAIQRRLSRSFEIGLPGDSARLEILRVLLHDEQVSPDVDLVAIAGARTRGYSGSDLREVCCTAVMHAVQEAIRALRTGAASAERRPLNMADFEHALAKVKRTGVFADEYRHSQDQQRAAHWAADAGTPVPFALHPQQLAQALQAWQALASFMGPRAGVPLPVHAENPDGDGDPFEVDSDGSGVVVQPPPLG